MTTTADILARVRSTEQAELEEAQRREERERAKHPDAAWGIELEPALAPYDPSPADQQDYCDRFRAENPQVPEQKSTIPGSSRFYSPIHTARDRWRRDVAGQRWNQALDAYMHPACDVCGRRGGDPIRIGTRSAQVCSRCRTSVITALAEYVAAEPVGTEGLSRRQVASTLVAQLLEAT